MSSSPTATDAVASARQWVAWDFNDSTRQVVCDLLRDAKANASELQRLFGSRLKFGTAGLRGPMAPGPGGMNDLIVLQTAQGICAYAAATFGRAELQKRGVVLGFDHRRNAKLDVSSRRFAEISAAVFAAQGVRVLLFGDLVATPLVPFCVVENGCCLGVMVTASHNPKEDNGYKIYWDDGVQITPPHDAGIAAAISRNLEPREGALALLREDGAAVAAAVDPTADVVEKYYAANVTALATRPGACGGRGFDVVYTAMHGVGHCFARRMFEEFGLPPFIPVESQVEPDADFPTVHKPNPEEKGALDEAKGTANAAMQRQGGDGERRNKLILANDPDADRLAVAEFDCAADKWTEFTGNEIGIMLASWQWRNRHRAGGAGGAEGGSAADDPAGYAMLTTAVSTQMLSRMASVEGFRYVETLTGFKWLGAGAGRLRASGVRVLFCFEEAIGYCLSGRVFDKDGVTAAAAFAELATTCYQKGCTVRDYMNSLYFKYGHFVSHNDYFTYRDPAVVDEIFEGIRNDGRYMLVCGDHRISRVVDVTKGFDSAAEGFQGALPITPRDQMVVLHFDNGCVITLRTSGTEPKLKYYCEMCGEPGVERKQVEGELRRTVAVFINACVEPEKHGLF